ncbi:MAG: hypothetical protein NC123_16775 [Butyrivibrio sp.]|nr:hypothetical protein [Acetatifactor muris]MCM1561172.1 hypothetical protein [Butyrivibrio sp.]
MIHSYGNAGKVVIKVDKKIRVSEGIRIEVNDNGDCIVAHVEDHNFIDNFHGLIEKFENIHGELKAAEAKTVSKEEQMQLVKTKMQEITGAIDGLFGVDTCKKVFGEGVIPSGFLIAEFFEQLEPIFREYVDKRQRTISEKYNRNRGHGSKRG